MKNTLVLISDEHSSKVLGCYGNQQAKTPNLDALADRGTKFTDAYCNSPLCVPSRASLHTGQYVHQLGNWDNAMPYEGRERSWAHVLQDAGQPCVSIGKLHFKNDDSNAGFDEQILPLHVKGGIGDATSLIRKTPDERPGCRKLSEMTAKGVTPYAAYDNSIADTAIDWLEKNKSNTGWTLFVSFVMPHFPLNAPEEHRALFDRNTLPVPKAMKDYLPENENIRKMRAVLDYHDYFESGDHIREAVAQYYALCSALDENIGRVLNALNDVGASEYTNVIYTSDHGDNLGARGFWGKATMWEESVAVPMILAGPDVPKGKTCKTSVSLIDLYPTILESADLEPETDRPGSSLLQIANEADKTRAVLSEYHATGSSTGVFMLRLGNLKLIHTVGEQPILYDLDFDPEELTNVAADPDYAEDLERCRTILLKTVDPELVNSTAFSDQAERIRELGGVETIRKMESIPFTAPPTSN